MSDNEIKNFRMNIRNLNIYKTSWAFFIVISRSPVLIIITLLPGATPNISLASGLKTILPLDEILVTVMISLCPSPSSDINNINVNKIFKYN